MEYGIWLSFNNQEEGFQIPVNPPAISLSDGGKGKTYDVLGLGEINVIKDPKLTEYTFESIFPAVKYPFVVGELREPKYYTDLIEKWMGTKRPIRFVFTGSSFDINTPASIEKFDWREVAGSPGDIEYTLTLKKYKFYAGQKATVATQPTSNQPVIQKQAPERPNDKQPPKTYRLVAGDTLFKVAKKQLGDDSRWRDIQKLNNISDAQLKRLAVGMELKLPS